MLDGQFDKISKEDIDALIANEVREQKVLEYKRQLPGGTDQEKIEFLSDISSFANASGGHIIYGLQDKKDAQNKNTGIPAYFGLQNINEDREKLRLEQIILTGIDPRIPGIQIKSIDGYDNGPVLIVRIPRSWASPHMVTFKNLSRFYSRHSSGKYQLVVRDIKAAFILSESIPERIRQFRVDHLAKIAANETPVLLYSNPKIVCLVVPIESFDIKSHVDIASFGEKMRELPMIGLPVGSNRFNFDGFLTHGVVEDEGHCPGYTQLYRNGTIELVNAEIIRQYDGHKMIPIDVFERELISVVQRCLEVEIKLGIQLPILVMLSVLGIKGYKIHRRGEGDHEFKYSSPIDKDDLILPEVLIESKGLDAATLLRSAFDTVWQAAGRKGSMNYDKNGKWIENR